MTDGRRAVAAASISDGGVDVPSTERDPVEPARLCPRSALERGRNLLNWTEPPVTIVAATLLSCAAAVSSAVLWLVPLNVLIFVVGMTLLTPFLLDGGAGGQTPTDPTDAPAPGHERSGDQDEPAASPISAPPAAASARGGVPARRCGLVQMATRVLSRVPDGRDVAHRHFAAAEQLLEAETVAASDEAWGDCSEGATRGDSARPHQQSPSSSRGYERLQEDKLW